MTSKEEERMYLAVFAAAVALAAVLLFYGARRAIDWMHNPPPAEQPSAMFPRKPMEPPPPAPGMTRTDKPPTFILPMRLMRRAEKRKAPAPPIKPEPKAKPDIRKTP